MAAKLVTAAKEGQPGWDQSLSEMLSITDQVLTQCDGYTMQDIAAILGMEVPLGTLKHRLI